jgi:hypothetical protein
VKQIRNVRFPYALQWGLKVWLLARVVLSLLGMLLWYIDLIPPQPLGYDFYHGIDPILDGPQASLLGVWQRWDAIHYIRIVQGGYSSTELTAFFPAFPLLGHLLHNLFGLDATLSLIVISNLSLILALTVFYQLICLDFPSSIARRSVVLLMVFPTAFFLLAPYAESLALALVLITFWYARRSRWILATLAGIGAGLTHPSTLPLTLGLAWIGWQEIRNRTSPTKWFSPIGTSGPILGAGGFLLWRANQGFEPYMQVQSDFGWRTQWPWETFSEIPRLLQSDYFWVSGWINLLILLVLLVCVYAVIKKLQPCYAVYYIALILFFLSTSREMEPFASWGRHALLLFPAFLVISSWLNGKKLAHYLIIASAGLQAFLAGLFFMWIWQG